MSRNGAGASEPMAGVIEVHFLGGKCWLKLKASRRLDVKENG